MTIVTAESFWAEYHGCMARSLIFRAAARKRGNPNWGKPMQFVAAAATEFEIQVRELGLTKQTFAGSTRLRNWCEHNRNRCYIPEWLLDEWKIVVDSAYSG